MRRIVMIFSVVIVAVTNVIFGQILTFDYPLNKKTTERALNWGYKYSGFSGSIRVQIGHQVSFDNKSGIYTYEYTITNDGSDECLFRWPVLGRVLATKANYGFGEGMMLTIKPKTTIIVTLKIKDKPVLAEADAHIWGKKPDTAAEEDLLTKSGISSPSLKDNWFSLISGAMRGPLPESWAKAN